MNLIGDLPERIERPLPYPKKIKKKFQQQFYSNPFKSFNAGINDKQKKISHQNNNKMPQIGIPFLKNITTMIQSEQILPSKKTIQKSERKNFLIGNNQKINIHKPQRIYFSYENKKSQNSIKDMQKDNNFSLNNRNFNSLQSLPIKSYQNQSTNQSNLSKFSKINKQLVVNSSLNQQIHSNFNQQINQGFNQQTAVSQFIKHNIPSTIHKLGKKPQALSKIHQNILQGSESKCDSYKVQISSTKELKQNDTQNNNLNLLSISKIMSQQLSEYVTIDKTGQQKNRIVLQPETYVFSQNKIPMKNKNSVQSINLQIQEHIYSNNYINNKQNYSQIKITNKAYINQQNCTQLLKINGPLPRISQRHSKVSNVQTSKHNNLLINENFAQWQDATLDNKKNDQLQNIKLLLISKQKQSQNLRNQLNNFVQKKKQVRQLQNRKQVEQVQNPQIMIKMSNIQIKKLKNQLKLLQIKQKIFRSKQQQYIQNIKHLKHELKNKQIIK